MLGFFTFSKLGWYVVEPSHLLVWALVAAAVLSIKRRRSGAVLTAVCAGILLALLTLPIGNWALRAIEDQYPRPPWPEHVDGVLILGEGLNGEILNARGVPSVGQNGAGFIAAWTLAQKYPQARVVFSGGSGELESGTVPEAQVAEQLFQQMGLSPDRTVYEAKSRNTWENILFSKKLVNPDPHEIWLLVASAYHVPRAMAVAKRLDWDLIPWPSDYLTVGKGPETHLSLSTNLAHLDLAVHEWFGLMIYHLDHKAL
ncbi:MAG: hypothetical protein JWM91_1102 [Rhodospirillales bacterium]|nr:hypothetical protein [Rhodospirillales bacterium]